MCDTIIREFMKGTIQERLFIIRYTELAGYISDYNETVTKANFDHKKKGLESIYQKYRAMQASSATVDQAIAALQSVKKAHAAIMEEIHEDRFTGKNIITAIGTLKDVHDHYNNLEELMLTCKTQVVADDKKGIICKGDK
jgi:hypothetical protein